MHAVLQKTRQLISLLLLTGWNLWHTLKINTCFLKHCLYRPIITTSSVYYSDLYGVTCSKMQRDLSVLFNYIQINFFFQGWHDPRALHKSCDMLYMHMDHSALTFQKTTALCIKLPRRANKEGIYDTVKATWHITSWESRKWETSLQIKI